MSLPGHSTFNYAVLKYETPFASSRTVMLLQRYM